RVLMFDSTLKHPTVVADTTAATANAYVGSIVNLIWYRGDSALLIDAATLSMSLIDPRGKIGRVLAVPRADDAQAIAIGSGMDAGGRLVYFNAFSSMQGFLMLRPGNPVYRAGKPTELAKFNMNVDSAWLVRIDLETRALDSVTVLRIPKLVRELKTD